ncbi:MAG: hypothetical protein HY273_00380 [Gammaproteobacteria bacterium]|nr:hypothetical protein [Gammaproteobacteria bacterium]
MPEIPAAVACVNKLESGIVPVMIVCDHSAMVLAIACQAGIADAHDVALTGLEWAHLVP